MSHVYTQTHTYHVKSFAFIISNSLSFSDSIGIGPWSQVHATQPWYTFPQRLTLALSFPTHFWGGWSKPYFLQRGKWMRWHGMTCPKSQSTFASGQLGVSEIAFIFSASKGVGLGKTNRLGKPQQNEWAHKSWRGRGWTADPGRVLAPPTAVP